MNNQNQSPDSRNNEYEKVPFEDLSSKVENVPQKVGNSWLQYVATASGKYCYIIIFIFFQVMYILCL